MSNPKKTVYRVYFQTDERSYSLLARSVREAEFFGFIEISEIIFDDTDRIIISLEDEALRKEFAKVEKIAIPHQYMRRIDRLVESDDIGVSYLKIADSRKKAD
ncbi:MAG TPA: DUF1820 family protein [Proteobacteria bacterium]|mgnify:CR=1 FL=1|nr:DUF1820 family protein [Pseudomonadota bacterium]